MMLSEKVYDRAVTMGAVEEARQDALRILCASSTAALAARLRVGVTPEDCLEEFLTAASLYALGAMGCLEGELLEFKAGDLTVKRKGSEETEAAIRRMERQADSLMKPYLRDIFLFAGV